MIEDYVSFGLMCRRCGKPEELNFLESEEEEEMTIANIKECCGERMKKDFVSFELVCHRCGNVEELATPNKTREEMGRTANPVSYTNLRKVLKKHEIFDAFNTRRELTDLSRWKFLGNLIHNSREYVFPRSVNYVCFLFDYF